MCSLLRTFYYYFSLLKEPTHARLFPWLSAQAPPRRSSPSSDHRHCQRLRIHVFSRCLSVSLLSCLMIKIPLPKFISAVVITLRQHTFTPPCVTGPSPTQPYLMYHRKNGTRQHKYTTVRAAGYGTSSSSAYDHASRKESAPTRHCQPLT